MNTDSSKMLTVDALQEVFYEGRTYQKGDRFEVDGAAAKRLLRRSWVTVVRELPAAAAERAVIKPDEMT